LTEKKIGVAKLCDAILDITEIIGTADRYVSMPSPIGDASGESVSFCSLKARDAIEIISNSEAEVIICSNELTFTEDNYQNKTLILVSNPRLAFIRVMERYFQSRPEFGIHPTATIDEDAKIHQNVYIGPNSYLGKCEIGDNTVIYGNVYIYSKVRIGRNVIIHAGTIIGSDGFSYERNEKRELEKFPHIGGVIIEDDVEIGSNVSIDRGTMNNTIIGQGTKIDNLVHIAHNVLIGKHCAIITQSMIGGGTKIGDYSWIAPGAIIRDNIKIGSNVTVGMGAVVTKNVGDGKTVFGVPAREH
jgi:UDP-3-O-[3-hydroxymyristoyl] glucosamine N-acyltransferase